MFVIIILSFIFTCVRLAGLLLQLTWTELRFRGAISLFCRRPNPTAVHTWLRIGQADASPTEVTQPGVDVGGGYPPSAITDHQGMAIR